MTVDDDGGFVGQQNVDNERPLIDVDRLAVPEWARLSEVVASTGFWRSVRTLPSVFAFVASLAWRTSRPLTALAVLVRVAAGCLTAFGLLATAEVFTVLLVDGPTPQRVVSSLSAMMLVVGSYGLKALLDTAAAAVEGALRPLVTRAADDDVTSTVTRMSLLAFEDADFRELVRRGTTDGVESVDTAVRYVARLVSAGISMTAAVVTAGLLNPWLTLVLLLAASADGWAACRVAQLNRRHFLDTVTRQMTKSVIAEATTSRRFALERNALLLQDRLLDEYRRVTANLATAEVRLARRSTLIRLAGRTVAGLGTALAYVVLALLLWTESMPLALAGTAVLTMRTASTALTECLGAVNLLYEGSHHIELYQRLLVEGTMRCSPGLDSPVVAPIDPAVIELSGVSFTYPGQGQPAVHGIDLTIRRGEVVALVGENGSGKTTLGKLITGLYPPTLGTVTWSGVDLATVDPRSVHDQVAVIAQSPVDWPTTAEQSIRIGRIDREDADGLGLRRAVELSGADEVLDSLPCGAQTVLSREFQDGQDLSGGQWQRLGIARGIYRDAHVLVADEPTAALDAKAEARVFAALHHASAAGGGGRRRTTILVTHRLANVKDADRIVVLSNGQIVEQGTHDELHAARGLYHELFDLQASAYRVTC